MHWPVQIHKGVKQDRNWETRQSDAYYDELLKIFISTANNLSQKQIAMW